MKQSLFLLTQKKTLFNSTRKHLENHATAKLRATQVQVEAKAKKDSVDTSVDLQLVTPLHVRVCARVSETNTMCGLAVMECEL